MSVLNVLKSKETESTETATTSSTLMEYRQSPQLSQAERKYGDARATLTEATRLAEKAKVNKESAILDFEKTEIDNVVGLANDRKLEKARSAMNEAIETFKKSEGERRIAEMTAERFKSELLEVKRRVKLEVRGNLRWEAAAAACEMLAAGEAFIKAMKKYDLVRYSARDQFSEAFFAKPQAHKPVEGAAGLPPLRMIQLLNGSTSESQPYINWREKVERFLSGK